MGRYRIKGKKPSLRDVNRIVANQVADEVERSIHSSDEQFVITEEMRGLLEQIATKVLPLWPLDENEVETSATSFGHYNFSSMTIDADAATIQRALQTSNTQRWHVPLRGGLKYLHHVVDCQRCQLMVKNEVTSMDAGLEKAIRDELRNRGISCTDPNGITIKDAVRWPKPN
jgi:hypothetical protein